MPISQRLTEAEDAHKLAIWAAKRRLLFAPKIPTSDEDILVSSYYIHITFYRGLSSSLVYRVFPNPDFWLHISGPRPCIVVRLFQFYYHASVLFESLCIK
jgi:hypothetical protein